MDSTRAGLRRAVLLGALCAGLFVIAGPASAATETYPSGGSGFDGSAEGWSASDTACTPVELLCSSEAAYDPSAGNPSGSLAARTTVTVNLLALFKGTATWRSPQFTVPVDTITGAEVRLEHAFDPGGLVDVEPKATYLVTLADLTTGTSAAVLAGELGDGDEGFAQDDAPVAVVGGHTYRLSIATETAQSTVALSLINGTTSLLLDNIGLTVRTASGGGGGGGGGGGDGIGSRRSSSLSDSRLLSLLIGGAGTAPAVLRGNRLLVKLSCPAKIGRACRIAARGMLSRHRAATWKRVVKIGQGKGRRVALPVRPKVRRKLEGRKRLLVREKVSAGRAHATVFRQRKLIRRG